MGPGLSVTGSGRFGFGEINPDSEVGGWVPVRLEQPSLDTSRAPRISESR